jgi:hypothetical protein
MRKEGNMKPKFESVLLMCVEDGTEIGWNRAHKHNDNPSEHDVRHHIESAVMEQIYEWFDFEEQA